MVFREFSMGFPCAPRSEGRDDGTTAGSAAAVALPAGPLDVALVPQGTARAGPLSQQIWIDNRF